MKKILVTTLLIAVVVLMACSKGYDEELAVKVNTYTDEQLATKACVVLKDRASWVVDHGVRGIGYTGTLQRVATLDAWLTHCYDDERSQR